ncbi:MAG: hypothetical protein JXR51_14860 [Bacteroidales bacterium]|nr:hypothetical protein [Bacteroidales bacterium]MBN2758451.1 hypothetical protein [Bacteroidales bacterium]
MKNLIILTVFLLFIFSSCEKIEPLIADKSEIPINFYYEQIYVQPIIVDNQIVAVINDNVSTFLISYDAEGNKNWEKNIDSYVIDNQEYKNIYKLNLTLNRNSEIILNMIAGDYMQTVKLVKFDKQGNFINQFTDNIHHPDTIFFNDNLGNADTLTNDSIPVFYARKILSLSDGKTLVLAHEKSPLIDSTVFQFSFYDTNGNFIEDKYSFIEEADNQYDINHIYLTSDDKLALLFDLPNNVKAFALMDLNGNLLYIPVLVPSAFNIFSFYENTDGNFIYTGQTFGGNSVLTGLIFCINRDGDILWQENYQQNIASIFLSVYELSDGYLFTGFNSTSLETNLDWRNSFINEKDAKAILLKTDFEGKMVWENMIQTQQESTFGAVSIFSDKITFFGQKISNNIVNTMFFNLDSQGNITN